MEALQWIACLTLGVPSSLLILLNWLSFVCWVIAVRRGHQGGHSFAPPFLCGLAGAAACIVCPWPGVWEWAWVPLLADPSIGLLLAAGILHAVARAAGLRSPFGRQQPAEPPATLASRCSAAEEGHVGFSVVACEVATGHVCHPDGRRYQTLDGPIPAVPFDTREVAEGWCREILSCRPELECVVRDPTGQTVAVYRPDPSGRPEVTYRRPEPAELRAAHDRGHGSDPE